MKVTIEDNALYIGDWFSVSFERTLRIPDDGKQYPLPPGLGRFPVCRVEDYAEQVPSRWRELGGFFIPMYQREALWLGFDGASWKPNAVQVGIGRINAVSGTPWVEGLSSSPQNYVVCPDQPWLDGINAGDGFIRQFVAMPLGKGYTVEAQLTGNERFGGIQIWVYEPKKGRFPDERPKEEYGLSADSLMLPTAALPEMVMGLGAGGKIEQKVYPDTYGIDAWDQQNSETVFVHIVNSEQYRELTGQQAPPPPIDASTYTEYGFPWFELYDEDKGDVASSKQLAQVKSVHDIDAGRAGGSVSERNEESLVIDPEKIEKITLDPHGRPRQGGSRQEEQ